MKKYLLLIFFLIFMPSVFANGLSTLNTNRITTLEDGILTVAVTGICKDNSPHHNCWVYKIFSTFAEKNNLSLVLKKVEFDKSWQLADADKVDVVATGITPFADRNLGQASYGNIYSIVKRGIRIKRENVNKFKVIADFSGQSLAAVKGMTSEKDLRNRATEDITVITPNTWEELYALFHEDKVAGIAEGFYVFSGDEEDINSDDSSLIVDIHDLQSGELEGNRFVVRNASTNLLDSLNEHIESLGLPNHRPQ